jgi:hypothetical protein
VELLPLRKRQRAVMPLTTIGTFAMEELCHFEVLGASIGRPLRSTDVQLTSAQQRLAAEQIERTGCRAHLGGAMRR